MKIKVCIKWKWIRVQNDKTL